MWISFKDRTPEQSTDIFIKVPSTEYPYRIFRGHYCLTYFILKSREKKKLFPTKGGLISLRELKEGNCYWKVDSLANSSLETIKRLFSW